METEANSTQLEAGNEQEGVQTPVTEPNQQTEPTQKNWTKMIPKEIAEKYNETLNQFDTFNDFVSSSFESMRAVNDYKSRYDGKVVLPDDEADQSAWEQVWQALGRPSDKTEYGIEEEELADIFYSSNLTKKQAEELTRKLSEYDKKIQEDLIEKKKAAYNEAMNTIKNKYGDEIDVKMRTAQEAIKNLGGDSLVSRLKEKGLDNDPEMIDFFVNVGTLMQEGNIPVGHRLHPKSKGLIGTYKTMEGIE